MTSTFLFEKKNVNLNLGDQYNQQLYSINLYEFMLKVPRETM